jgi:hypothetical protein
MVDGRRILEVTLQHIVTPAALVTLQHLLRLPL